MDEHTIDLLKECSSGCKMAIKSISQVREYAGDKKLEELLDSYDKKHKELEAEIGGLLEKYHKEEEKPSMMAEVCSWVSTEVKMLMHADSHQIAKLMMDGCNMGIQSLSEYINKYMDASKESENLARKLIKVEEDFMTEMREFC